MWTKEPTIGVKASMVAIKVTAARVLVVRSVELRYTLQGRNKDKEKHQVANGGRRKVDDMLKEAKEHIIGGDRGICKESIIRSDNIGGDRGICKESISLSDNIDGDRRICKESIILLDKVGWMEKEERAPLSSKAETVFTVECSEDLRVWGVPEVWNKKVGMKTVGEDHSSHALWQVMSEGRQRG